MREIDGFVLTRSWRDTPRGLVLTYWLATDAGPVRAQLLGERAVMFAARTPALDHLDARPDERRPLPLRTLGGEPVDALYFASQSRLQAARDRLRDAAIEPLESDVKPSERYLMERFVTGGCRLRGDARVRRRFLDLRDPQVSPAPYRPRLSTAFLDIETDGANGPVISIAIVSDGRGDASGDASGGASAAVDAERVFMVGDGREPDITYAPTERALLVACFRYLTEIDPDALCGWNLIDFDLLHLQRRCDALGVALRIGRGERRARVLESRRAGQRAIARIPGRVALDGIGLLKSATYSFERFGLDDVARELLGRGKQIDRGAGDAIAEIRRMYRHDRAALAAYNAQDCRLVRDIFARTDLIAFAIERQRMTGLPLDRIGGSVAAFDYLYLPRLHRAGYVARDAGRAGEGLASPGGYVLASEPGLHDNVLVLDFKSLYPSIICTFQIDPLGLALATRDGGPIADAAASECVGDAKAGELRGDADDAADDAADDPRDPIPGFDGARFSRRRHILPSLISALWRERDAAKRVGDAAQSRAIKILMNSFYGVLGASACRFYDPRLASSITRRGHEILTRSRDWIAERGWRVIYGDTDSLFVLVGAGVSADACRALGERLARELTDWWRERLAAEHRLESRLEMEFETHYERFFMPTLRGSGEGSAKRYAGLVRDPEPRVVIKGLEAVRTDWTPLARGFQRELLARAFSGQPVADYVRQVRRRLLAGELDDQLVYHKRLRRRAEDYTRSAPPHVQAARLLGRPVREIAYVWTRRGPEPVDRRTAPLDYEHYLLRQLAPASEGILRCLGTSFDELAGAQLSLFGRTRE